VSGGGAIASVLSDLPYHVEASKQNQCHYYIKRKKRNCLMMATDGSDFCSQHQPDALAKEQARSITEQGRLGIKSFASKGEANGAGVTKETSASSGGSARISATQTRMVNPFSRTQWVAEGTEGEADWIPNWQDVFDDLSKPLLLDLGCARGGAVMKLAETEPGWNFLGI